MQVIDITTSDRWRITRLHERWQRTRDAAPRVSRPAAREYHEACGEMAAKLARQRGWILGKTAFSVDQLRHGRAGRYSSHDYCYADAITGIIDHPEHFRWPTRPFRPAAILTHSYRDPDAIASFARDHGLVCELLPWSWYYPGHCTAALLMRDGGPDAA